jgi:hypothetical protein
LDACSVFSVFKVLRRTLQFKVLLQDMKVAADAESVQLMKELGVRSGRDLDLVFAHVPMCGPHGCEGPPQTADVRTWYNKAFLPRLEGTSNHHRTISLQVFFGVKFWLRYAVETRKS